MANRTYLYSANREFTQLRDLSETPYDISLVYKILLGAGTEICPSKIWDYDDPIAIKGNFREGLDRLNRFYDYLKTQSVNSDAIEAYQRETTEFFHEHRDRNLDLFLLEAGELYEMLDEDLKVQNNELFAEIVEISNDVDLLLRDTPNDAFSALDRDWLAEIEDDFEILEPFWTTVTYFSFNET